MREPDLKGLMLGELEAREAAKAREALEASLELQAEWGRLAAVRSGLEGLPSEDPPRRIAFVSDPVVGLPWWERMLSSWPKAAFASACVLAMALVGHGMMTRPAERPPVDVRAAAEAAVAAELAKRPVPVTGMDAGAMKALEAKLAGMERRLMRRQEEDMVAVGQQIQVLRRDLGNSMRAANLEMSEGRRP